MKLYVCQLRGPVVGDKSSDAYPTKVLCQDCVGADERIRPDALILSKQDWDASWPEECEECGYDPRDD